MSFNRRFSPVYLRIFTQVLYFLAFDMAGFTHRCVGPGASISTATLDGVSLAEAWRRRICFSLVGNEQLW